MKTPDEIAAEILGWPGDQDTELLSAIAAAITAERQRAEKAEALLAHTEEQQEWGWLNAEIMKARQRAEKAEAALRTARADALREAEGWFRRKGNRNAADFVETLIDEDSTHD